MNHPKHSLLSIGSAVQDWIQQNGYEAIAAPREIWYGSPGKDAQWDIVWRFQELQMTG